MTDAMHYVCGALNKCQHLLEHLQQSPCKVTNSSSTLSTPVIMNGTLNSLLKCQP